jgi:hypothetical protein
MGKIRLILITVFAVVIGCIGLLSRTMPPPWYSRVSLAFVGYTNAPSGERLVSFVLSNNSRVRTRRFPVCELVSEQQKVVAQTPFPAGFLYLDPGQTAAFAVAAPGERQRWRAALLLSREGLWSKVADWIGQSPRIRSHIPMKWRGVPSKQIYSEWVPG